MSKTINFGILLITLCTLHVSYNVIEGNVIPLASNKELLDFLRNKILERSNYYRKKYNYQQFTLNAELNEKAQKWANELATSTELNHDPRNNDRYGEILAKTPPLLNLGERVVDIFYSFVLYVNYKNGTSGYNWNEKIRPLTQLLWKTSENIGVGVSQNNDGDYYVVIYYYPGGNVNHWYSSNVPLLLQSDVLTGVKIQESFNKNLIPNIFVSTLTSGKQQLPEETRKYRVPYVPRMYTSSMTSKGLNKFEACKIRQEVFDRINHYRNIHEVPRLSITEINNSTAQNFVHHMAINKNLDIYAYVTKRKNLQFGENKYRSPPTIYGNFGKVVVDIWYNQIRHLRENMNGSDYLSKPETGVLTQILWKSTKTIGVGVAVDDDGNYYLLVHHYPAGNVANSFPENLPRFTSAQIRAGATANNELKQLAGRRTDFYIPFWKQMIINQN